MKSWRETVALLIREGQCDAEDPLDLLRRAAKEDSRLLWQLILQYPSRSFPMNLPALAAWLGGVDESQLHLGHISQIQVLLKSCSATDLLLLTELLRSKVFGRGLGSKFQKMIRYVVENWTGFDLKEHILKDAKAVYALLRLIHPRFYDERATVIKDLLSH